MRINLITNFEEDLRQILLENIKYKYKIDLNLDSYSYLKELKAHRLYFYYLINAKRIPMAVPRNVHFSKELINSEFYLTYKKQIENITNIFKNGKSIKPFLNKDVKDIFKEDCRKDYLLNDWDLYHLHLGELKANAKFCTRTKNVLFCKITDTDVYMILILDHTIKENFAHKQLLTIIRDNWDDQFNLPKLEDIVKLDKEYSNEEYRKIRELGCTALINIDDNCYLSPNLGMVSSGDSCKDVRIADEQLDKLNNLEKIIQESSKMIYDFIIKCNLYHRKPSKIYLKLKQFSYEILVAKDVFSKLIIELYYDTNNLLKMVLKYNANTCIINYIDKK